MAKGKKTGGRVAGTPNKLTADLKVAASEHGPGALQKLVKLMNSAISEQVQLGAANSLLDRAYGKPAQDMTLRGDAEAPLYVMRLPDPTPTFDGWADRVGAIDAEEKS